MRKGLGIVGVVVLLGAAVLAGRGFGPTGTVVLSDARAEVSMASPDVATVFVTLQNGALPDRLSGVSSDVAELAELLGAEASTVPVPANSAVSFSGDGVYVQLSGLQEPLENGQLIPITLDFEHSGAVTSRALVGPPSDPHAGHAGMMAMGPPLLEDGQAVPTLGLIVSQQDDGTWQVTLETADFTFDADRPEPVHVAGHGHAHIYLDGLKVARVHDPSAVIGVLPAGTYTLRAALNTNDHRPYLDDGGPVQATAQITVD